ncbi:hypothetical protein HU200_042416 [Digitaria exilis]|uniref:TF-B3 domain-containing protein n=1 Tax=Digitaria exilis TaxID=1010633 RepID=A0A835EID5_9POAL|nr:hypothetical protein HU200_042416 [Digitaria exilis]
MASCGNRGAAGGKHLRVLLPFTTDTLRIPDDLAEDIGAEEAFVVSPFGKGRVRPVEVGEDGDGAFLGRGWSEFAGACGVRPGWFLVLRHHGSSVLTVKVFDASCCLTELANRPPCRLASILGPCLRFTTSCTFPLMVAGSQEIPIPANFAQNYISKGDMNNRIAVLSVPLGKICQVEVKMNGPETFFSGGLREPCMITLKTSMDSTESWQVYSNTIKDSRYLLSQGWKRFCQDNSLKEGDLCTFYVVETTLWHVVITRCKEKEASFGSTRCIFEIGPPAWMKKEMNTSTIERVFSLPLAFCVALGLREPCTVTLKTSLNSTMSWQARVVPYKNCNHLFGSGWKRFCHENRINEGDICTFNVVDTKLWHVVITHQ